MTDRSILEDICPSLAAVCDDDGQCFSFDGEAFIADHGLLRDAIEDGVNFTDGLAIADWLGY